MLLNRTEELTRLMAGVAVRAVRCETLLEALEAARHRTATDPSAPATEWSVIGGGTGYSWTAASRVDLSIASPESRQANPTWRAARPCQ